MRGITSRVDIVWRRRNKIVKNTHKTAATIMGNLLVYRNSYTISKLRTSDDGVVYECSLIVQASLQVGADDTFRLDVTGEYFIKT